jgi:hypothetical protein
LDALQMESEPVEHLLKPQQWRSTRTEESSVPTLIHMSIPCAFFRCLQPTFFSIILLTNVVRSPQSPLEMSRLDSAATMSASSWQRFEKDNEYPFDLWSDRTTVSVQSRTFDTVALATLNAAYASMSTSWSNSSHHNDIGYRLWQLDLQNPWTVHNALCVNLGRFWRQEAVYQPSLWQLVLFLSMVNACKSDFVLNTTMLETYLIP